LHDLYINPRVVVQLLASQAKEKPSKRAKISGPVFMFILEAFDEKILEIYVEKVHNIMIKDDIARVFEWKEIDLSLDLSDQWKFDFKFPYNYFNKFISLAPGKISCTTCHKLPISMIENRKELNSIFDNQHRGEFPAQSFSLFARSVHLLPNGHCVFAGGFNAENVEDQRKISMDIWHKKVRYQVKYGGVHYWLGEAISQSIVESDAYTPEFIQFFKDIKRVVDPNFLLSPNKFHMYHYDHNIADHIVKDND
ncbi:MAG: hypothetical protein ACFE9R_10235, partial [Candidatus Hermodarchaeota archaeon]